ncbi:MAG TPA: hypothetical protein VLA00_00665 [Xanthobacteraceae bacterium]|nr:hypothetical protein [Xanthobacteraceae bacterium]
MPLYTFRTSDDPDTTVVDLADDDAAWREAVTTCAELLRDIDGHFPSGVPWELSVVDESGRPFATIRVTASKAVPRLVAK